MKHLEQGTPEWLENRKTHIGASDISCINGTNPWKSAYVLWLEKTDRKEADVMNAAMKRGNDTEPRAREVYMENTGNIILPKVMYSDEWFVGMASLDGITQDETIICEIKCPTNPKLYNNALKEIIPAYYIDQMQWQLWVTKADKCDFFVFLDEFQYAKVSVYPDEKYQETLLEKAFTFWNYVTQDIEPPRQASDVTYIDNSISNDLSIRWKECKEIEDEAANTRKHIEYQIKDLHKNEKCYFTSSKVKMNWVERKGSIDWKCVCEKWKITDKDLEEYRKINSHYATFTIVE